MTDYENFCYIVSEEQLVIKSKENINLSVGDKMLRLLDVFYILAFTMNLISTTRLWRNSIGIYFPID